MGEATAGQATVAQAAVGGATATAPTNAGGVAVAIAGPAGALAQRLAGLALASPPPPGLPLAGTTLQAGLPLALDPETGRAIAARADTHDLCFVIGLVQVAAAAGDPVFMTRFTVSLPDWSAVAGTALLALGQTYFLAPAGGLTLTPPAKPDSVCNLRVGQALTPQTLVFGNSTPILL